MLLGIIVVKLFISDLLPSSSDWWTSKGCEYLSPLLLSLPPLISSLLLSFSHCFSISLLPLSYLIAKVHRCESIHQTILILKALLCHIKCLLHCHSKSNTQGKYEAGQEDYDIDEINVMCDTSGRTNESQGLEVSKAVVNEGQEDGSEDQVTKVDDGSSDALNVSFWGIEGECTCQDGTNHSGINSIALKYNPHFCLWFVTRLIYFRIQIVLKLKIVLECLF